MSASMGTPEDTRVGKVNEEFIRNAQMLRKIFYFYTDRIVFLFMKIP